MPVLKLSTHEDSESSAAYYDIPMSKLGYINCLPDDADIDYISLFFTCFIYLDYHSSRRSTWSDESFRLCLS